VQARELMDTMFGPLVAGMGDEYKLEVEFRRNPERVTQGVVG
jgi:hypothetical protein